MKPIVFVARPVPPEVEQYIAEHGELRKWDGDGPIPREIFEREMAKADGLLTTGGRIDRDFLQKAPRLKVISNISVGYNNFDTEAMRARKVLGTHTPNVLDDTVADLMMALMLAAARRICELDQLVKQGRWSKGPDDALFGRDVHHANLGIIGMGRIGEALAKRAIFGFDMKVAYANRNRKPDTEAEWSIEYMPMDELLAWSDFVAVMTPLNEQTRGMIGREQFRRMKRTAVFINASRGPVVDEAALIEALQTGEILAAGLDVYDKEPVSPDNPLLKLPNAVTVPHIGSATAKTRADMAMLAARNLISTLQGKPRNVVPELQDLV